MLMSALARPEKEELKDEERQQRVQDQHQEHDKGGHDMIALIAHSSHAQDQPLIPSPALLRYSQYTHSNISTVRLEGCTFKSGALEAIGGFALESLAQFNQLHNSAGDEELCINASFAPTQ